jgi:hypothetical protein
MTTFNSILTEGRIDLSHWHLLKSGGTRDVYGNDALPGVLVKTLQPQSVDERGYFRHYEWWKKWRPLGAYFAFRREIDEFIVLLRRFYGREPANFPFARLYGVSITSAGLGLIIERISGPDGNLAPTMKDLMKQQKFEERHLEAVERFFADCRDLQVVLGDLSPNNIVYTETRDPRGEFVAVDGIGEKTAIPIHRWIKFFNDRKLERARRRFVRAGRANIDKAAGRRKAP